MLDVPKVNNKNNILPRTPVYPLVGKNLSELNSAPGRQAASMIRTTHLRSLEAQLSAVSTATSLAETNPSMAISSEGKLGASSNIFVPFIILYTDLLKLLINILQPLYRSMIHCGSHRLG